MEAAIRETEEEIGLLPKDLEERGVLSFYFLDGYALEVHLYLGWSFSGDLVETDEADPFWIALDDIPFDRMWADDELWLPHIIDGERVTGRFIFDGDKMEDYAISYLR